MIVAPPRQGAAVAPEQVAVLGAGADPKPFADAEVAVALRPHDQRGRGVEAQVDESVGAPALD